MIEIRDISKSYGDIPALKSLSLSIKKGEFYSLLGPNGAGKTTTINLLGGLMHPDAGEILIDGINIKSQSEKVKSQIGIVPQEIALYDDLSASENLRFWAKINGVSSKGLNTKIEEILSFLGLSDRANQNIAQYSGGMKRRINIAAALLHDPDILFFDEPTVGIDPQSRSFIYSIFKQLSQQGKTILYTSHYLEEVEKLSDRIGIIDYGELIAEGTFEELREQSGLKETINLSFQKLDKEVFSELQNSSLMKNSLAFGGSLEADKCVFVVENRSENLHQLVQLFADHKIEIQQIEIKAVDLEQVYLSFTKNDLRD